MKKNILILNILCALGLILWACGFFFGLNYTQGGALMVSIPASIFVLLIMGALVYAMKRHSKNVSGDARVSRNTERLAFAIYLIVALGSSIYICHFVNVTLNAQSDIQGKAQQEIQELGRIFDDSDVPASGSYMAWLLDEEDNYERTLTGEGKTSGTIEKEKKELEEILIINSGFADLQTEVLDFLGRCQYSVENWVWITIPNYLAQLESKKSEYESKVEECSRQSEYTKNEPFKCNSQYNYSGIGSALKTISWNDITIIGCILILILQCMILLTYFSERPSHRNSPKKFKSKRVRSYSPSKENITDETSFSDNNIEEIQV